MNRIHDVLVSLESRRCRDHNVRRQLTIDQGDVQFCGALARVIRLAEQHQEVEVAAFPRIATRMRPEEDDSLGRESGGDAVHNLVDGRLGGHLILIGYFTSAADFPANSSTHVGKIPSSSVPSAGRISAARNPGVSGSAFSTASPGSRMYIITRMRR